MKKSNASILLIIIINIIKLLIYIPIALLKIE